MSPSEGSEYCAGQTENGTNLLQDPFFSGPFVRDPLIRYPLIKEEPKLYLKQAEPKPKLAFDFGFGSSRKLELDIWFRPWQCRNRLFSQNFGRN